MNNRHQTCLSCNAPQIKHLAGYYADHEMVHCISCGLVFMEKIPTPEELDAHYSLYSYGDAGYLSPITIKSYQLLLDEFEPYRKTNRILDVGCGRGWFLSEAKKRGWEVYGTEYSKTAVGLCEQAGIEMQLGELNPAAFKHHDFDVITSFEVMEHINTPQKELQAFHQLLRSGGLFYCTTPNFNSVLRYYLKKDYNVIGYPEHLIYFTKSTLNRIVCRQGFKNVKFLSTGISITRFKLSKKTSTEKLIAEESADEVLRRDIDRKWYLKLVKSAINTLLTWTNTGMTLKGYYEKK